MKSYTIEAWRKLLEECRTLVGMDRTTLLYATYREGFGREFAYYFATKTFRPKGW